MTTSSASSVLEIIFKSFSQMPSRLSNINGPGVRNSAINAAQATHLSALGAFFSRCLKIGSSEFCGIFEGLIEIILLHYWNGIGIDQGFPASIDDIQIELKNKESGQILIKQSRIARCGCRLTQDKVVFKTAALASRKEIDRGI